MAPSKVEAALPGLRPRQLDPPKTGSLLSAAFYRTIKPEVQVRSLRPVVFQKGVRLRLQDSSALLGCWRLPFRLGKILTPLQHAC